MARIVSVNFHDLTRAKLQQSTCDPKNPLSHHSEIKREELYMILKFGWQIFRGLLKPHKSD